MDNPTLDTPTIKFHRATPDAKTPKYANHGDAGADIFSIEDDLTLEPGQRRLVDTGITIEYPAGYGVFVHPRSGLGHTHGISIVNAPGTIDAGYRGSIKVNLINLGQDPVEVKKGDKIAQIVVQPVAYAQFTEVKNLSDLSETTRGDRGHGSTGR